VPFPKSVTITAGAVQTTPTVSWDFRARSAPDAFRVIIYDVDGPTRANGVKDVIHSVAIPKASTSHTIPATLSAGGSLQPDHNDSIGLQVLDLRPGVTEDDFTRTNNNALILNRSSSFFNFQPLPSGTPSNISLPQVGVGPNPSDAFGAPINSPSKRWDRAR
jgi:hypothetical protein